MTTIAINRNTKEVGADTQNTAGGSTITRVRKIEQLSNGYIFLGSGHCYTIGLCRQWALAKLTPDAMPDWSLFLEDTSEYAFDCLVIDPKTWRVWLVDGEMVPNEILDDIYGIGSGAAYAVGALKAGASMLTALEIAGDSDAYTSGPYEVKQIG